MLRIGCHLSSSKGYCAMAKDALKIHANTFQYFSRNPRGGNAKALDQEDIARFLVETDKNDIHPFLAHAPYTLNGCSADPALRDFAIYPWKSLQFSSRKPCKTGRRCRHFLYCRYVK